MAEQKVAKRRKKGWMDLKVVSIVTENPSCKTLCMVDAEDSNVAFDYDAGQYLTFRFDDLSEKPVVRSYTMSSAPHVDDSVHLTVREVEDPFVSKYLCRNVEVGMTLRARGPIGNFCYFKEKDNPHLVMIAAGSGVTPFVSMIKEYLDGGAQEQVPAKMTLIVGYRSKDELICWQTLEKYRYHPKLNLIVTLSREKENDPQFRKGRISEDLLTEVLSGEYDQCTFMTCGPQPLMDMVKAHAQKNSVVENHIKFESF